MIGTRDLDSFISRSQTAIATTIREDGSPSSSMISYARDGDRLYFSTTTDRVKGRTLARDPRVALCIINLDAPDSFVSVEGTVTIHRDNPKELRELLFRYWDKLLPNYPKGMWATEGREQIEPMLTQAGRAIFEVTPTRVSGFIF